MLYERSASSLILVLLRQVDIQSLIASKCFVELVQGVGLGQDDLCWGLGRLL